MNIDTILFRFFISLVVMNLYVLSYGLFLNNFIKEFINTNLLFFKNKPNLTFIIVQIIPFLLFILSFSILYSYNIIFY